MQTADEASWNPSTLGEHAQAHTLFPGDVGFLRKDFVCLIQPCILSA